MKIKAPERDRETFKRKDEDISLHFLVNRILHYCEFLPNTDWRDLEDTKLNIRTFVTILSKRDSNLSTSRINVEEFLSLAQGIAEDDDRIVGSLLRHTKKFLGQVVYAPGENRRNEIEALESLIDLFEIIRNMGKEDAVEGQIVVYHEVRNGFELLGVDKRTLEYGTLLRNLFESWDLIPFRQFQPYKYPDDGTTVQGRMLKVHPYTENMPNTLMIRAEDILDFLDLSKEQFPIGKCEARESGSLE